MHIRILLAIGSISSMVFPESVPAAPAQKQSPAKGYVCQGPVGDCQSTQVEGTFGCAHAIGSGDTKGKAYSEARADCEEQLKTAHGGKNFHCHDLTGVTCQEVNSD